MKAHRTRRNHLDLRQLLGILTLLGSITAAGCGKYDLTAPQVCVEYGTGTDSNGDPSTICKKYGPGSWL